MSFLGFLSGKIRITFYGFAFSCGMLAASAAQAQTACALNVGWETWFPYAYVDAKGELTGFDIEIVRQVGKAAGCDINFLGRGWARVLKDVEKGELSLAIGATQTAEREAYARFTRPYRKERVGVLVRASEAKALQQAKSLKELAALPGPKLGAVRDWEYGDEYESLMKDPATAVHFDLAGQDEPNLRKLLAGRLKGMIIDLASATVLVREVKAESEVETLPLLLTDADIHIMVSKAGTGDDVFKRLDEAIGTIQTAPEVKEIYRRYSGS